LKAFRRKQFNIAQTVEVESGEGIESEEAEART